MDRLYIASTEPHAGKTVLAAALTLRAQASNGTRAAYLKPVRVTASAGPPDDGALDPDAVVIRQALGADGDDPSALVGETVAVAEADERVRAPARALEALAHLEGSHDIAVLEGLSVLEGGHLNLLDAELARSLEADVLLVAWYQERDVGEGDVAALRAAAEPFGDRLCGLLLNGVPELRRHYVETELAPLLRSSGLPFLGVIPQTRILGAPTLGEIVAFLGGEVIAFPEGLDELAERVMLGALALDGGIYYYGQAPRKIVITRWDRPDLQMPALATGCQGLVLTGGQGPIPHVWNRVQELRVPVAVVPGGTIAVATRLNDGLLAGRGRAHPQKAREMADLLDDLPGVLALLSGAGARG